MKCVNCGAEIKDGSIYCPVCGKEAQVVNGYTSLEDDFLHSLIREGANDTNERQTNKKNLTQETKAREQKKRQQLPIVVTCIVLALFIVLGIIIKVYIDYKNDNSYEYQVKMAQNEVIDHNYELAMQYYARALAIHPTDIACRMEMVDIYLLKEDYDAAVVLLQEVVQLDDDKREAYELLIDIYAERGQYEQIRSLAEYTKDPEILELFDGFLIEKPVLYPEGGNHSTGITITMVSVNDYPIYYTTDGSDPLTNGILYVKGIDINRSGNYTIRAVCKNIDSGVYSEETEKEYQVVIVPPSAPKASPAGGSVFSELTHVTLTAEEECSIYYTWDGTVPTAASAKYTEPIAIPEGEYILFAIAINERTGLSSEVMQESYTYIVEAE